MFVLTMSHLMTCGDAPNCTWTDLVAMPTLAGVKSNYRGLDEEKNFAGEKKMRNG